MSDVNYLNMSDEELLNAPPPDESQEESGEEGDTQQVTNEQESQEDATVADEAAGTAATEAQGADSQAEEDQQEGQDQEQTSTDNSQTAIDYEKEYKRLLAPFKANGRDVEVKSVEDAITLMQMGANYNKKMAALKPNLQIMKLLENNGLLSEEKLSFLIDLDKKNPGAINKLVKDSGIDPLDIDAEKAGEYQPNTYRVDEREMALDTVLEEIQDTTTYTRTLGIVSKEWDGGSKQVIADNPELLKVINDHVARGVYDVIQAEMERERMFGRLSGLTDLEAYRQVGDAIQARGGFNHLASPQGGNQPGKPVGVVPQQKQPDDAKLKDKKRAASSTQPGAASHSAEEFNPLALSDEEFAQLAKKRFQ